jgi:tRNA(Arg) A34 adenosine deaminase TadA
MSHAEKIASMRAYRKARLLAGCTLLTSAICVLALLASWFI